MCNQHQLIRLTILGYATVDQRISRSVGGRPVPLCVSVRVCVFIRTAR